MSGEQGKETYMAAVGLPEVCEDRSVRLTKRELEVLSLASRGRSSKQIARELGISESTANFHIASVKRKFGMRARAQAVATVVQADASSVPLAPPNATAAGPVALQVANAQPAPKIQLLERVPQVGLQLGRKLQHHPGRLHEGACLQDLGAAPGEAPRSSATLAL